jgi:acylpyruvate hydrolase
VPGEVVGALDDLELVAPVPAPGKVVCVGRNYAEHAAETGSAPPTEPQLFAKWANAVVGPGVDVVRPRITAALDYEVELVAVIGTPAREVTEARALDHVLGYTCGNDISARDLQFGDTQWTRGKALDTFAPMGPWIVTTDEIPDPQVLGLRTFVNGESRQDDTTANMLFSVARIIAFVTEAITLEPGDVIYTGTPPGVGVGRNPPVYLDPGDLVRVEIDRIGAIENRIVEPG